MFVYDLVGINPLESGISVFVLDAAWNAAAAAA